MSANSTTVVNAEFIDELAQQAELEDRRRIVHRLRLRGQSPKAIAAVASSVLGAVVSQQQVHEDLAWLRQHQQQLYGPAPIINPAQEIGDALEDFQAMEEAAWMEFHGLKAEAGNRRLSPMFIARARQGWLRTAALMRTLRVKLLAEHGMMQQSASPLQGATGEAAVGRAEDIRRLLRSEGLLLDAGDVTKPMLSDEPMQADPLALLDDPAVEAVDRWADDGGFGI